MQEHTRFQLEAAKLGRIVVFQVTVYARVVRRKTTLYAETQCADPYHNVIQFIIRDAESTDDIIERFTAQLRHRGFDPIRFRLTEEETWGPWSSTPEDSPSVV
jgi:hypothetical protein